MLANDEGCWLVRKSIPGSAHFGEPDQAAAVRQDLATLHRVLGWGDSGSTLPAVPRDTAGAGSGLPPQQKPPPTPPPAEYDSVRRWDGRDQEQGEDSWRSDASVGSAATEDEVEVEALPADLLMRPDWLDRRATELIVGFIRDHQGEKVRSRHVASHLASMGARHICAALRSKYGEDPSAQLGTAFGLAFDCDGDGFVTPAELRAAGQTVHFHDHPGFQPPSPRQRQTAGGGSGHDGGGRLAALVAAAISGEGSGLISVKIFEMLLQS